MKLHRLQLSQFRNMAHLDLSFEAGMTILAGPNAQGKTNLLEAVYVTATGRSPRTHQEGDLISWGASVGRAVGTFESERRGRVTVEVALARKEQDTALRGRTATKRIKVNDVARNLPDLAGLVPVVLFLVDDLEIIRGEPSCRRAFLDTDLSAMSRTYAWTLRQYGRVLEQRNRLLKDLRENLADPLDLQPWNAQLAAFGGRLWEVRARFIRDLNAETVRAYQGLTASPQALTLAYRSDWLAEPLPADREECALRLAEALDAGEREEIQRGSTLVGPHRDDVRIQIDGRDVRLYGSQGEQRTAALALRVAEFALVRAMVDEPPVLLLDDIFSELDRTRRDALLGHLAPVAQVILTTTDVDAMGVLPQEDVHIYRVAQGTVTA